jgi:hypothetical protein
VPVADDEELARVFTLLEKVFTFFHPDEPCSVSLENLFGNHRGLDEMIGYRRESCL